MPCARSMPCAKSVPYAIFVPRCSMVNSRIKNLAKNITHNSVFAQHNKFSKFTNRYKFYFMLVGNPTSGFNTIKLAAFIHRNSPAEYTAVSIDSKQTVVFWNP